ncbi:hypothetical protein A6R68_06524 [Neotoma lepida]|uniref:HMG box domain-containing protein n=1 Tax=Neotoma lepida TaxID=56216 RepID=A0A1A6GI08_NEOLE|nr:hypothetical protein A6R68_06524 [Neotoma lepida]
MCEGCRGSMPSQLSLICIPKCFSSNLANYPKKPMTSYLPFSTEQLLKFKAKHPDAKLPELIKKIAAAWRELPDAENKKVYEADFKAEWKAYKEAMSKFKDQLTPSQLVTFEKVKSGKNAKDESAQGKLRTINQAWKNLSSDERQAYIQLAKDDRIR